MTVAVLPVAPVDPSVGRGVIEEAFGSRPRSLLLRSGATGARRSLFEELFFAHAAAPRGPAPSQAKERLAMDLRISVKSSKPILLLCLVHLKKAKSASTLRTRSM